MARIYLDRNNEFIVKEWKTVNIIIGVVFAGLFIFALYNLGFDNWKTAWLFIVIAIVIIIMAWRYGRKSVYPSVIFRINETGLYYYGTLITGWDNFFNAYVTNEMEPEDYADNFQLVVEFYREDHLIRRKLRLTNTQDKSEEEIYGAVMYFHKQHASAAIETIDADAEVIK